MIFNTKAHTQLLLTVLNSCPWSVGHPSPGDKNFTWSKCNKQSLHEKSKIYHHSEHLLLCITTTTTWGFSRYHPFNSFVQFHSSHAENVDTRNSLYFYELMEKRSIYFTGKRCIPVKHIRVRCSIWSNKKMNWF